MGFYWRNNMKELTIAQKFNEIMDCGLQFQIYNRPVQNDYLWDIKTFWREMQGKEVVFDCNSKGFDGLDDCLNDMLKYVGL